MRGFRLASFAESLPVEDYAAADKAANKMAKELAKTIEAMRKKIVIDPLTGQPYDVALEYNPTEHLNAAFENGVELGISKLPSASAASIEAMFNILNPRAIQWIDTHAASMVVGINQQQVEALRTILRLGFLHGYAPPQMAMEIRKYVGLTPQYATALFNYQKGLIEQGKSASAVEKLVEKYRKRLVATRATTIARTETIRAANMGQQMSWQSATAAGLITTKAERMWIVTRDDRTCKSICVPMRSQKRGLDQAFMSGKGYEVMTPPAHPRCRCAMGLVFPD